ncbi:MAG: hypothetical protein FJ147_05250 [Deltaproteobacteria bacterium]|nr:hypothetical protein [Deltaproteobacteria bacterium]
MKQTQTKTQKQVTLFDLIQSVSQCTEKDDEVVATVAHLINSGKVRLPSNASRVKVSWASPLDVFPTWARPKLPPSPPQPALAA